MIFSAAGQAIGAQGKADSVSDRQSAVLRVTAPKSVLPIYSSHRQGMHQVMNYRVFDPETRAPLDTLELHVLARAYYAAWQAVYGFAPEDRHPLPMLNVAFEYSDPSESSLQ